MKRMVIGSLVVLMAIASLTFWWKAQGIAATRSHCGKLNGRLVIKQQHQLNQHWCWVATASEVLKWYGFSSAGQCNLYDISWGTNTCKAMKTNPNWTDVDEYDWTGAPEEAANTYDAKYGDSVGHITVSQKKQPMSFDEVIEQICPADGTEGSPFIWTHCNQSDVEPNSACDPNGSAHDLTVMGYTRTKTSGEWLRVHDPDYPTMELYSHDAYSDKNGPSGWLYDVVIAKK